MSTPSLASLLQSLKTKGQWYTDYGPKHPQSPNSALLADLKTLLTRFQFIEQMPDYVDFLQQYAGASYTQSLYALSLDLLGISHQVSTHLLHGPGEAISTDGILVFGDLALERISDKELIGVGFGLDATGERPQGIYRSIDGQPYSYYCDTFTTLLARFVEKEGYVLT